MNKIKYAKRAHNKQKVCIIVIMIMLCFAVSAIYGNTNAVGNHAITIAKLNKSDISTDNNAKSRCEKSNSLTQMSVAKNDYKNRININRQRKKNNGVPLPIIMYHNIIADTCNENDYEVKVSTLERDMKYLKDNGYMSINTEMLSKIISGELHNDKYVMLTFDDGFYSYLTYLPTLLEKYDMRAVVSVVGEFSSNVKVTNPRPRCGYLNYNELKTLEKCGRVEIACHTDDLHRMKGRKGVNIIDGENVNKYKEMLASDTDKAESKLAKIGVTPTCYTYPYGEYCDESESLVRERGYQMTLTCYEHVNYITNDPECMCLLGRYNRKSSYLSISSILESE